MYFNLLEAWKCKHVVYSSKGNVVRFYHMYTRKKVVILLIVQGLEDMVAKAFLILLIFSDLQGHSPDCKHFQVWCLIQLIAVNYEDDSFSDCRYNGHMDYELTAFELTRQALTSPAMGHWGTSPLNFQYLLFSLLSNCTAGYLSQQLLLLQC